MLAVVNQTKSGLPYGLVLSKVFEFFKIDIKSAAKVTVKEVIDVKNLTMSNLQVDNGALVRILPNPPESPVLGEPSTAAATPYVPLMLKNLLDDNVLLMGRVVVLDNEFGVLKTVVQGYNDDLKDLKDELKLFKEMFGQFTGLKGSTAQSNVETELGLDDLANAVEKDGNDAATNPSDVVDHQMSEATPTKS